MANPNSAAQRSFAAEPYDSVAAVLASKQITAALVGQRIYTKDGAAIIPIPSGVPVPQGDQSGVGISQLSLTSVPSNFGQVIGRISSSGITLRYVNPTTGVDANLPVGHFGNGAILKLSVTYLTT